MKIDEFGKYVYEIGCHISSEYTKLGGDENGLP